MIETGLIAGDTGIDFIGTTFFCLNHKIGISQKRSRHRDYICIAIRQYLFRISGVLIRLDVTTGTENSCLNLAVTQVNAALEPWWQWLGFASCQPMPVLIIVAPAFSIALPSCITSSALLPPQQGRA